jgi:aldehyde dehydrogenase (NAD+)
LRSFEKMSSTLCSHGELKNRAEPNEHRRKISDHGVWPAPEDPKESQRWLDRHGRRFAHFINGAWQAPAAGEYFDTLDPSNGEKLASIAQGSAADVDAAVQSARVASPKWRALTPHARARYLVCAGPVSAEAFAPARRAGNHGQRQADPREPRHRYSSGRAAFYYHAGWAQLLEQEFPEHEPCGVVGQIIPWNFPLLMRRGRSRPRWLRATRWCLKPAEFTPLTALAFAELCQEAGLPAGVVNIVTGDGSTGEALVKHPDVDKIAFTGSTEVGRAIRKATATGQTLSLELGGKSPFIVFDDADLDSAVEGLVDGIWFNQGQVCCAGSRLLMQESIAEVCSAKIRERMSTLRIGDASRQGHRHRRDCGSRATGAHPAHGGAGCRRGRNLLAAAGHAARARVFLSADTPQQCASHIDRRAGGNLRSGAGRDDVPHAREAVELANNTVYGLAACVWSENINVALHVAAQLKAGVVWVNCTNLFDASCGFGGYRESGFGREGGREGLLEYLEPSWFKNAAMLPAVHSPAVTQVEDESQPSTPAIDRTVKLYIGGKQARPDSGYSMEVRSPTGTCSARLPWAIAKTFATPWKPRARPRPGAKRPRTIARRFFITARRIFRSAATKLFAVSQLLSVKSKLPRKSISALNAFFLRGVGRQVRWRRPQSAVSQYSHCHERAARNRRRDLSQGSAAARFSVARHAASRVGNTVIAVPSEAYPLITRRLYQLFDTSDLPGGAVNIVTGYTSQLLKVLAEHDDVDAIWCFGR